MHNCKNISSSEGIKVEYWSNSDDERRVDLRQPSKLAHKIHHQMAKPRAPVRRKIGKQAEKMKIHYAKHQQMPHINDFILIANKKAPKKSWKVGRIAELKPGDDGEVQKVTVKFNTGRECSGAPSEPYTSLNYTSFPQKRENKTYFYSFIIQ